VLALADFGEAEMRISFQSKALRGLENPVVCIASGKDRHSIDLGRRYLNRERNRNGWDFKLRLTLRHSGEIVGVRIIAGCRVFTIGEARQHWHKDRDPKKWGLWDDLKGRKRLNCESLKLVDRAERVLLEIENEVARVKRAAKRKKKTRRRK
jgi:hypothetical protein